MFRQYDRVRSFVGLFGVGMSEKDSSAELYTGYRAGTSGDRDSSEASSLPLVMAGLGVGAGRGEEQQVSTGGWAGPGEGAQEYLVPKQSG